MNAPSNKVKRIIAITLIAVLMVGTFSLATGGGTTLSDLVNGQLNEPSTTPVLEGGGTVDSGTQSGPEKPTIKTMTADERAIYQALVDAGQLSDEELNSMLANYGMTIADFRSGGGQTMETSGISPTNLNLPAANEVVTDPNSSVTIDLIIEEKPGGGGYENGDFVRVGAYVFPAAGSTTIPKGTVVTLELPAFVDKASIEKAINTYADKNIILREGSSVTGGVDERKVVQLVIGPPDGVDSAVNNLQFEVEMLVDLLYYNGDTEVKLTVGSSYVIKHIHINTGGGEVGQDGFGAGKKAIGNVQIISSDGGNPIYAIVDYNKPVLYSVTLDIPVLPLEGDYITVTDTFTNVFQLCDQNGNYARASEENKESILQAIVADLRAQMEAANDDPTMLSIALAQDGNGFTIRLDGPTQAAYSTNLLYYVKLTDITYSGYLTNKLDLYMKGNHVKSVETQVLTDRLSALTTVKYVLDANKNEVRKLVLAQGQTDVQFVIKLISLNSSLREYEDGYVFALDTLDEAFTYAGYAIEYGSAYGEEETPITVVQENNVIQVVKNGKGRLKNGDIRVVIDTKVNSKFTNGESRRNAIDGSSVDIYRSALLNVAKNWDLKDGEVGRKGKIEFKLTDKDNAIVWQQTLDADKAGPLTFEFDYFTAGILDGENTYTLTETLIEPSGDPSDYKTQRPVQFIIEKGSELDADENTVYFVRFKTVAGYEEFAIESGNAGKATATFTNPLDSKKGEINFTKYGKADKESQAVLDGSTFRLAQLDNSGNFVAFVKLAKVNETGTYALAETGGDEVFTTKGGKAVLTQLPYGKYRIYEVTATDGYHPVPSVEKTVGEAAVVAEGSVVTISKSSASVNTSMLNAYGQLTFKKVQDDEKTSLLDGGTFALYTGDTLVNLSYVRPGIYKYAKAGTEGSVTSFTTNGGIAIIDNLPYGTYVVEETSLPDGYNYEIVGGQPVTRTTSATLSSASNKGTATLTLTNIQYKGDVAILKQDNNGKALDNVKFTLYPLDAGNAKIGNGTVATTANGGAASFTNLPVGNYVIEEATHFGYEGPASFYFTIEKNGETVTQRVEAANTIATIIGGGRFVLTWVNEELLGKITFTKVEETTKTVIAGAKFRLYNARYNDTTKQYEKNGAFIQEAVSGQDGIVTFEALPYGHYIVEEYEADVYHIIGKSTEHVYLDSASVTVAAGEWANPTKKGSIEIAKKQSANGQSQALSGIRFKLFGSPEAATRVDGTALQENTSSNQGLVTFTNLEKGVYYLLEVQSATWPWGQPTYAVNTVGLPDKHKADVVAPLVYDGVTYDGSNGNALILRVEVGLYGENALDVWNEKIEVVNHPLTADFSINKTGEDSGASGAKGALLGAKFVLKLNSGSQPLPTALYPDITVGGTTSKGYASLDTDATHAFTNVLIGHYTLEEVEVPEGYAKMPAKEVVVAVKDGEKVVTVKVDDIEVALLAAHEVENYYNELTLLKLRSGTNTYLTGAKFKLQSAADPSKYVLATQDGHVYRFAQLVAEADATQFVTAAFTHEGSAVAGFQLTHVPAGTYKAYETSNPDWHHGEPTVTFNIGLIDENNKVEAKVAYTVTNSPNTGTLTLKKLAGAAPSTKALQGVTFALVKDDNTTTFEKKTDTNGSIHFENLPYGYYRLHEADTVDGYVLLTQEEIDAAILLSLYGTATPTEAALADGRVKYSDNYLYVRVGWTHNEQIALGNFYNQSVLQDITLNKVSARTGRPIAGAVFTIQQINDGLDAGIVAQGGAAYITSDTNGKAAFNGLGYGLYQIKEYLAPAGYDPSELVVYVAVEDAANPKLVVPQAVISAVDAGGAVLYTAQDLVRGEYAFRYENEEVRGKLSVRKQDNANNPLPGATFKLIRVEADGSEADVVLTAGANTDTHVFDRVLGAGDALANGEYIEFVVGNSDAIAYVERLPVGEYKLVEVQAPSGYTIAVEAYRAFITTAKPEDNVTVTNNPKNGAIRAVKVDKGSSELALLEENLSSFQVLKGATLHLYPFMQGDEIRLENGTYSFYDEQGNIKTPLKSAVTPASGIVYMDGIPMGEYILVEVAAPEGYTLNRDANGNLGQPQRISMTAQDVETRTGVKQGLFFFANTPRSLTIKKMDLDSGKALPGTVFEIWSVQLAPGADASSTDPDDYVRLARLHTVATSGADGTATLVKQLQDGKYLVEEVLAPAGYVLAEENRKIVTFAPDSEPITVEFKNRKILGSVTLVKEDDAGAPIDGAQFELVKLSGPYADVAGAVKLSLLADAAPVAGYEGYAIYDYVENGTADAVQEFAAGKVMIRNLPEGYYAFVETKSPENYFFVQADARFEVNASNFWDAQNNAAKVVPYVVQNVPNVLMLAVQKRDKDTPNKLVSGVTFALTQLDAGGQKLENTTVTALTVNGVAFFRGLNKGTYLLEETVPAYGYMDEKLTWKVVVSETGATQAGGDVLKIEVFGADNTPVEMTTVAGTKIFAFSAENTQIKWGLRIRKVDRQTGLPLEGAVFSVRNKDTNEQFSFVSGGNGLTEVVMLPYGAYLLYETAAPDGYRGNVSYDVMVNEEGIFIDGLLQQRTDNIVTITAENTASRIETFLYKTDSASGRPLAGVVFTVKARSGSSFQTLITDNNGETSVIELKAGEIYDIVEVSAPEGYIAPLNGWTVRVGASGRLVVSGSRIETWNNEGSSTAVINIRNTRNGYEDEEDDIPLGGLPQTGDFSTGATTVAGALVILLGILGLYLFARKPRQSARTQ